MKLTELEPELYRYDGATDSGGHHFARASSLADADAVMSLCPKCFAANGGPVGTHSILGSLAGRNMPHEADPNPRWHVSGQSLDNLTLSPSILFKDGCGWHGWITTGAAVTC